MSWSCVHGGAEARSRVISGSSRAHLGAGKEAEEEALVAALLAAGADADAVDACAIRPLLASGHELSLLREGGLDAVCVGSAEEANALAAALEAAEGAVSNGTAAALLSHPAHTRVQPRPSAP